MSLPRRSARLLIAGCAVLGAIALAGCSDDDPATAAGTDETTTTVAAPADAAELSLTAVDYAYEGLPDHVAPGSHLHLTNASDREVHEAVVFRVPDDRADTPLEELLAAAEADPTALGEFVGVTVALPGQDGIEPEGSVVFEQPGRYVVACFVPVGADPAVYEEALATGEPPPSGDALPHLAAGMVTEVVVD